MSRRIEPGFFPAFGLRVRCCRRASGSEFRVLPWGRWGGVIEVSGASCTRLGSRQFRLRPYILVSREYFSHRAFLQATRKRKQGSRLCALFESSENRQKRSPPIFAVVCFPGPRHKAEVSKAPFVGEDNAVGGTPEGIFCAFCRFLGPGRPQSCATVLPRRPADVPCAAFQPAGNETNHDKPLKKTLNSQTLQLRRGPS